MSDGPVHAFSISVRGKVEAASLRVAAEAYYLDAQRLYRRDRACSEYGCAQQRCRLATGDGSPSAVRRWLEADR